MNLKTSISQKGTYLHSAILASNDGLVTTFAVVAGSLGAHLDPKVIVILGVASLFADGFSMATGNYLGAESEKEYQESNNQIYSNKSSTLTNGLITFFTFVIIGVLPVFPYFFKIDHQFLISVALMAQALYGIGMAQGLFTKKNPMYTGLRSLIIGGIVATVAYIVGVLLKGLPLF
ncbi:hypothetical protein COV25_01115 [candidate division WWE3 bacterium CG10_big_fil_rev_8_21_14_0_10_35_32]|nr:MAG: hypothetical protein COV25_01115 [candidate division WWE3 bacterium CG10_big_fil_rev_8_21_14_0_10_35_32]